MSINPCISPASRTISQALFLPHSSVSSLCNLIPRCLALWTQCWNDIYLCIPCLFSSPFVSLWALVNKLVPHSLFSPGLSQELLNPLIYTMKTHLCYRSIGKPPKSSTAFFLTKAIFSFSPAPMVRQWVRQGTVSISCSALWFGTDWSTKRREIGADSGL